jgi:ribosome biogenesis GTPase
VSSSIGLVLRIDAKVCHVEIEGKTFALPQRGKLFDRRAARSRLVAVGDRVRVSIAGEDGAIEEVLPRTSKLSRGSAGRDEKEHVIAANVSLVLVVASVDDPAFQTELVDRIFAGAEHAAIPAALALTKCDLDAERRAAEIAELYAAVGYRTFALTRDRPATELLATLHENVTVLCGASGVGKSSLLNRLAPELGLRVGEISKQRLGAHTTSHTELLPLPGGGHVLDTPGIRGFELFEAPAEELAYLFREMRPFVASCQFRDCTHIVEPRCAVRDALAKGSIAASRYASYRALRAQT